MTPNDTFIYMQICSSYILCMSSLTHTKYALHRAEANEETRMLTSLNCSFNLLSDWNQTTYGSPSPFQNGQSGMVLPIVLQHLVPFHVSLIGLGSIAAAVMSSVDSVLLSAASLLGRNILKNVIFKQVSGTSGDSVIIASSLTE